jgi:integrase
MKIHVYESAFAEDIVAFLEFKETMGFSSNSREWNLWKFDGYCAERKLTEFDKKTVEGWVECQKKRNPGGCFSWMSYIRDLGRYLKISGRYSDAYVLPDDYKAGFRRTMPYLLSAEMITDFFNAAEILEVQSPWAWQAKCFFGLMHSMGLRTCEVMRLDTGNINLGSGYIDILWSKGSRSRRLPINDEITKLLAECRRINQGEFGGGLRPFFVTSTGKRVCPSSTGIAFNRIWDSAGLPRQEGKKQPRAYDFRHHFAYANIERWAAEGKNVEALLPYLARYMGHATFDSTYYYIHTSPDFMSGYASDVRRLESLIPEVTFDD